MLFFPADEAEQLLVSEEKGKAQMNSFIEQRLNTNPVSFWDAIPNLKINTFSSMTKKTTIKSTNEKLGDRCKCPAGQRERDPLL